MLLHLLYAKELVKIHGEDFDWQNTTFGTNIAYASGGKKAHGW
jgi:hypothetical protein